MWGAIAGDIIGSRFEHIPVKDKNFELFSSWSHFTDDSLATIAVAQALIEAKDKSDEELAAATVARLQAMGKKYPLVGWGHNFKLWLKGDDPQPYGSFGNGAAMRVSAVAYAANSEEEVKRLSRIVTGVSHNHPEGIKGAECVAMCTYLALHGVDKEGIFRRIEADYYPNIAQLSYDDLIKNYTFDITCQGSVPQAMYCFYIGKDFEDVIRNAVSLGGDADTLGAMAGAVAEAYYGIPEHIKELSKRYLKPELCAIVEDLLVKLRG